MSIKFIFSELENNLKKTCIERIVSAESGKQLLIVPEQNTLSTDAMLLEYSKEHAFLFSNVLSFKRLAYYVLNETSGNDKGNLTAIGQLLVIKKVLHEIEPELKYYKNAIKRPGFATQISETINQMARYAFTSEDLRQLFEIYNAKSSNGEVANTFLLKMHDLNLIYLKFNEKIKENYLTNDDLLHVLAKNIKNSKYIQELDIYITSFYSFSVLENLVIKELAKYAKSLTIAIPMNKEATIESIRDNDVELHDFYQEPKRATKNLLKIFDDLDNVKISVEYINTNIKNETISYIINNINNPNSNKYKDEADNINFINCDTKYSETELVAKYVQKKVLDEGYRYKDIVIVCPDFESYGHILKHTFRSYNIPIFYDKKDFMYKNRVIECIRSGLESVLKNMKYESVFRFLKSGVPNFDIEQVNYLDNYIVEYGIRGYMWAYDEWRYGQDSKYELKYDLDEINSLKNAIQELLSPLKNEKLTVRQHCENLYNFIKKLGVFDYVDNKIKDDNVPVNVKREYELVWEKLILLLEQMNEVLGDDIVSFEEFVSIFDTGVKEDDFGHIPTFDDQVTVANINRSKVETAKIMIFMDASDKNYPKYTEQNIIFDAEECENILNAGYRFLDNSLERLYAQNLVLFLNISKVEDELLFTKVKTTMKGDEVQLAKSLDKIRQIFSKELLDESVISFNKKNKVEIKSNINTYKNDNKVYGWYKSNLGRVDKDLFYSIENEDFFKHKLSKEVVEKLYGDELLASVSKLERYVQCPYAYFLNYNIKGKPKKVYEVTSMDYGQIIHLLFEMFVDSIKISDMNWKDISDDYINSFVDEQIEFCLANLSKEVFLKDSRYKVFLNRISEITKVSIKAIVYHINSGKFEEIYSEASFKNKGEFNVLNIIIGSKNIRVSGEIDRVDLLKSKELDDNGNYIEKCYVKIIDYKSNDKKFEVDKFYYGLQLQLVVYLETVLENQTALLKDVDFDEIHDGGVFYFSAKNPIIEADNLDDYESSVIKEFRMSGIYSNKNEVIAGMDKKFDRLFTNGADESLTKEDKKSFIFPAEFTAKNKLTANSTGVEPKEMVEYREYATHKIKEIGQNIFDGIIETNPTKYENFEYCSYCDFKNVCKIDLKDDTNKFNEIKSMSKDVVREKIKEDLKKFL